MLTEGMFLADRYEIIGKIGAGGMSDVYKAKDNILGRYVAIKVLKSEFSEDRTFVTKFRTEAQSAAGLEHPNIVNIYDVGSEDGLYYIVMEYVEGITLKTYIEKKGQLAFKESASIAIQVARGIEMAHNKGIIHRDIKPQNIIISTEGKVKVTDFGIAKAASSNTVSADVMGSVHYASPEQARNGFVDCRSDIYSLGIVMYEMITGRVPFDGDTTVAVAIQHLQEDITKPSTYAPSIPFSFEQIILKTTLKNPDRRYQNISELMEDLRHSLTDPDGDFVLIAPSDDIGKTKVISPIEIKEISHNAEAAEVSEPVVDAATEEVKPQVKVNEVVNISEANNILEDEDQEDIDIEDEGSILNPKVDKAVTILGIITAAIIVIVIIYFVGVIFGWFNNFGGKQKESQVPTQTESQTESESESESEVEVAVPDVVGKSFDDAKDLAERAGLTLYAIKAQSSNKADGTILELLDLEVGQMVTEGTQLNVVIAGNDETLSKLNNDKEDEEKEDKEEVSVPSVIGKTKSAAESVIKAAELNYSESYEYSSSVAADTIISQSPSSGKVAKGTTISIVISQGEEPITVPSVIGLGQNDAQNTLSNAGLKYAVNTDYSDSVPEGNVISQTSNGSKVAKGTTITITVSLGKKVLTTSVSKTCSYGGSKTVTGYESFKLVGSDGTTYASGGSGSGSSVTVVGTMNCSSGTITVVWTYTETTVNPETGLEETTTGTEVGSYPAQ